MRRLAAAVPGLIPGLLVGACLSVAPARAAAVPAPLDMGFEEGQPDSLPVHWSARHALRRGYRVALRTTDPHGGRLWLEIRRDSMPTGETSFGAVSRRLAVGAFRGRRARLAGWLRYEASPLSTVSNGANLWLRADRADGTVRGFANTQARPVLSSSWTRAEIVIDVPEDSDTLTFGAFLDSPGSMGVDDVELTDAGERAAGDQPARPLEARGLANLVALTRLLGYVRYFHPSDSAATADWGAFAVAAVDSVEPARSPAELAACLERLFAPLAPSVRVATRPFPAAPPAPARETRPAGEWIAWLHLGCADRTPNNTYRSVRVATMDATGDSLPAPGSVFHAALGGGVWCEVPLALIRDPQGTLPRSVGAHVRPGRALGWTPNARDRATRLAGVALLWNAPQHFYPYFDVVGDDWSARLEPALRSAAVARDAPAFGRALGTLMAGLHDGHVGVYSDEGDDRVLPLAWRFVGDRLIVLRADSSVADRVRPGDEVVTLRDRPVRDWVREKSEYLGAATPQHLRHRLANALLTLSEADTIALGLRAPGEALRRVTLVRRAMRPVREARPDSVAELRPGILYVDLDRVTTADFQAAVPRLAAARGIVFDLRGYPRRIRPVFLSHLTDSVLVSPRWEIPIVTRPDRLGMRFMHSEWPLTAEAPRFGGRVAFLIDGRAISYAETCLGIVEYAHLAERVGEPTAGTNGNITRQALPGGVEVLFTGMKVLKRDGSRHHGVGIGPTVPVSPTQAGIAAGRDEQLEKAIEVVSR